jgi:hypothetical protein
MLRWPFAFAVVSAGIALAAPAAKAPDAKAATWADWVGDFEGALAWRNCSAPGAARATVAIDGIDGALEVDLTAARGGLRRFSLVEEEGTLAAQDGDLKLTLKRPRPGVVDLAIELDSGCAITGRLSRGTTNVAACDRLSAWARVESRCTKLRRPRLEDTAALAKTAWKAADAAACTTRADRLEHALVDTGCAPHPDPLIGVRAVDCLALAQAAQKLSRCGSIPRELSEPIASRANALAASAQSADAGTLPVVEAQCRDARADVVAVSTRFRCTP